MPCTLRQALAEPANLFLLVTVWAHFELGGFFGLIGGIIFLLLAIIEIRVNEFKNMKLILRAKRIPGGKN